ncbi:hypothetical protein CRM76_01225 [Edwardsiella tarda]|uniref:Uncharacterized protein n=2 Tax=Edwardsiella tarda TaxID=636 RepID=A0A2A7U7B2_EDWTA|nr:hypothetical protein CRM76_01225 [Edwardsiella tarda]
MMRSGLSKTEMDHMPVTMFYRLYIFDTYLEPQSPRFQDLQNAMMQYTIMTSSPNMTSELAKKIKPSQFQLIKDETIFKSAEELREIEEKRKEEQKANLMSMFDPALVERLKNNIKSG